MIRTAHCLLLPTLLIALSTSHLSAQVPPGGPGVPYPPPAPPPFAPQTPPIPPPPPPPAPSPPASPYAPDPFCPTVVPAVGNPGCAPVLQSGWYAMFEISVLFPEIHSSLSGGLDLGGKPANVTLGSAGLTATGSPRLEIGYRFGDDIGAVAGSYRFIATKGGGNSFSGTLGDDFLQSQLDVNDFAFDYISPAINIVPLWDFAWRAGLRIAAVYYDDLATNSIGQLQASNNFIGAGPHGEVEVSRAIMELPGLAVLAKLDGAVLFGNDSQSFAAALDGPPPVAGSVRVNHYDTVPVLTFDLGVSYSPPGSLNWAKFGFGYQFEYWWDVGSTGGSHGSLGINGLYFRGEFSF
jgi:hypothetical protein